jgi:hypothetical protein
MRQQHILFNHTKYLFYLYFGFYLGPSFCNSSEMKIPSNPHGYDFLMF